MKIIEGELLTLHAFCIIKKIKFLPIYLGMYSSTVYYCQFYAHRQTVFFGNKNVHI
jgi:hypothetical protein